jgi:hypothetical protein
LAVCRRTKVATTAQMTHASSARLAASAQAVAVGNDIVWKGHIPLPGCCCLISAMTLICRVASAAINLARMKRPAQVGSANRVDGPRGRLLAYT